MIKSGVKTYVSYVILYTYSPIWLIFDKLDPNLTSDDFSGEPLTHFNSNKLYLLNNLSHNNFPWLRLWNRFSRFTNRDRAKNYRQFPNSRFRDMIFYLLIFPHKHPEGTQLVKKITRYPSSTNGLVETISNCQIYSFYVISAFFTWTIFATGEKNMKNSKKI